MPGALTGRVSQQPAKPFIALLCLAFCLLSFGTACSPVRAAALYENNFENAEIGKVPDDFLVLEGGFAVKQEEGNKLLELPGAPLDSFAALFGPTESSNLVVSASINGTGKGRRYPTFGVGLNGVAGYKLQVSPAKSVLEIYRDQAAKATVSFEWKSGEWTLMKLQLRSPKAGEWRVEGKAWPKGSPEPAGWMISFDDKEPPPSGRPSVFGSPFSGLPIKFDDLVVQPSSDQ